MKDPYHLLKFVGATLLLAVPAGCAGNPDTPKNRKLPAKTSAFVRATPTTPLEVVKLYYDSKQRLQTMAEPRADADWRKARFDSPLGNIEYGVTTGGKKFRKAVVLPPNTFVVGDPGERFGIYVKNNTSQRMEAVISVDGLDVVDAQPASFGKRGYIIQPGEKLFVEGWRKNMEQVLEMQFVDLRNRGTISSPNAGVIGIAVFADQPRRF